MTTLRTALLLSITFGFCCPVGAQDVPWAVATSRWPAGLGNQRARLEVAGKADAVWAHIPWRRRDSAPEKKNVLVVNAAGKTAANRVVVQIDREQGDVVFQADAPGEYFVYYMPFSQKASDGSYAMQYASPQATADAAWLERNGLSPAQLGGGKWRSLPQAKVAEFQSLDEFHRFDPMEVAATAEETKALLAGHADRSYLLFPEDRRYPIRMSDDLPLRWIRRGPSTELNGSVCRGEFYVFQVGLYAARKPIDGLAVEISDLAPSRGKAVPAAVFHAFNLRGTDWLGRPMEKRIAVPGGKVQALWFGVQIPKDAAPGNYRGLLTFRPRGAEVSTVRLSLMVSPKVLEDGGVSDLWRYARLKWLDSTMGLDDEVVAPYTPLVVHGRTVACLGRQVTFGPTGLPESVRSMDREILARPMNLVVETGQGPIAWQRGTARLGQTAPGAVAVESHSSGKPFDMDCQAKMESDGCLNFRVSLQAREAIDVRDIRLEIPYRRDVASYMMGFCRKGGYRPSHWKWVWNVDQATNMVWLGDFNAGLQCKLKGPKDTWDITGLYDGGIPPSWGNSGKGGATVDEQRDAVLVRATSGPRSLQAGEKLEFRFQLLVTPFKPLDASHWTERYYHFGAPAVPVDKIAGTGATVINCHHANELNPHINYPFRTAEKLAAYVAQAHARGIKTKIYYTVRELSNYVAEMWALRSLGSEVFIGGGEGGGDSWLREHLLNNYSLAWHQPLADGRIDAAIGTVGLSRWHNYYVEGLGWLVNRVGIDGIYLDGIGYDREIMKRVRKVLDRSRPGCLIDFHSGNEFPGMRISPANKYMEHFPYLNSIWFGECYDYNETSDYWLVEISGIPFGLYGEMLEGGGNPWRGMIYGMTGRLCWSNDSPIIWKLWDDFGIRDSRMLGYWDPACPVKTGRKDVLATAYVKRGKALIALASWAPDPADVKLAIDWRALGLDPARAALYAPAMSRVQPAALFRPEEQIPVAPARGWLLILDEAKHDVPAARLTDVQRDRVPLLEDRFDRAVLGEPWKTAVSSRPKTSLKLDGGNVVIEAPANNCAMIERPLPPGATLAQCAVFSGTDKGASWGPGMTLAWKNKTLRINLRGEGRCGVDDGAGQWFGSFVAANYWYYLRIRLERDKVLVEVSPDNRLWEVLHVFPRDQFPGDPAAVRLGKMSSGGKGEDYSDPGALEGSCRIKDLQVFGAKDGLK
jgi:hypothetical protein